MEENEHRGHVLRDDTRKRHAVLRHAADNDEKQVEDHVQDPGDHQIGERALRIAVRAEHAVAEVEDTERRHSERVDAEVEHGALDEVVLRAEELQHEPCGQQAEDRDDTARREADHKRGAHGRGRAFLVAGAEMLRDPNVDGASHSDEKAREQGHENRGGADCPQRLRARELADDRDVRHIEQHL